MMVSRLLSSMLVRWLMLCVDAASVEDERGGSFAR